MNVNDWIGFGLVVILSGYLLFLFRIAREDERFAVIVLGRFQKLVGPGLLIKPPGTAPHWERLRLGQFGQYTGDGIARFGDLSVPVKYESRPATGVRIERFEGNDIWVAPSKAIGVRCEKCGHQNQVSTD